jgi:ParB family chromosome partitioning protein
MFIANQHVESRDIDPRLLRPHRRNRTFTDQDLADLKASIPVVGIVQPLLVAEAPDADGFQYQLVVGHRRRAAAIELDLPTVPCLVTPDPETAMLIATMLVENKHRIGYTAMQEADMYAQLALLDWDEERISTVSGEPVERIRAAITLTRLPAEAQQAADDGVLNLADAAELEQFRHEPATVAKLLKRGNRGWSLKHAIADEQKKRKDKDELELFKAQLLTSGAKVIPAPKGWPYGDHTEVLAKDLAGADGNRLDPEVVKTKPGFAVIVTHGYGSGPRAEVVCTDPEAWGWAPAPGTAEHARRERDAARAERDAYLEAFATATGVRHTFLRQTYTTARNAKTLFLPAMRTAVTDVDQLKFPKSLTDLSTKLAGFSFDDDAIRAAGIDRLTRALVARWICAAESNIADLVRGSQWGHPDAAVQYLDLLVDAGYALSDAEAVLHTQLIDSASTAEDEDNDEVDGSDELDGVNELDDADPDEASDNEVTAADTSDDGESMDALQAGDDNTDAEDEDAHTADDVDTVAEPQDGDATGEPDPADTEHLVAA